MTDDQKILKKFRECVAHLEEIGKLNEPVSVTGLDIACLLGWIKRLSDMNTGQFEALHAVGWWLEGAPERRTLVCMTNGDWAASVILDRNGLPLRAIGLTMIDAIHNLWNLVHKPVKPGLRDRADALLAEVRE